MKSVFASIVVFDVVVVVNVVVIAMRNLQQNLLVLSELSIVNFFEIFISFSFTLQFFM